jgi:hypothetical protein
VLEIISHRKVSKYIPHCASQTHLGIEVVGWSLIQWEIRHGVWPEGKRLFTSSAQVNTEDDPQIVLTCLQCGDVVEHF